MGTGRARGVTERADNEDGWGWRLARAWEQRSRAAVSGRDILGAKPYLSILGWRVVTKQYQTRHTFILLGE